MKTGTLVKTKKSQVTIFIIIALVIVAVIAVLFYPKFKNFFVPQTPGELIPKICLENAAKESLNLTMSLGGKIKPELYFRYNNKTINYLCYTSQWYKTCTMQTPFLKQAIESEVNTNFKQKTINCITEMENQLKSQGYNVKITGSKAGNLNINPDGKVRILFNMTMALQKGDLPIQVIPAQRFQTEFDSKSYELIMISSSILNYEARFGDSTPEIFATYYPSLRIEKKKQDDGTKVYILTDRDTNEQLVFATRSLAWPPGYAI